MSSRSSARRRRSRAIRAALAVATVALILDPSVPAQAHAVLISAIPAPGIGLGSPPREVRLRLSEPLRLPPSDVRVIDREGRDHVTGLRLVRDDPQSVVASIPSLGRGVYEVEWKSVSTLDGHTIRGSYFFGVGEAPPGGASSESGPLAGAGAPGIAFRIVQDAALLLLLGLAALAFVARHLVPRVTEAAANWLLPVAAVAFGGALATGLTEGVAASGFSARGLAAFLTGSAAGWGRFATIAAAAAAFGAARKPVVTGTLAAIALAGVGISGHAGATTRPAAFMSANAVHLVMIGVWLGGAAGIALVWRRVRLDREEIVSLIGRLSPLAIGSAVLVAATGAVNAWGQLAAPSDLWRTGYGGLVTAKIAALVAAATLGARHSFVLRRRLRAPSAEPRRDRTSRGILAALSGEGWVAATAVVLATILVAFPDPPAQEARADELKSTLPAIFAVGDASYVTVAQEQGPMLITLTIGPPRPGPVTLAVQLVSATNETTEGWTVRVAASGPAGESRTSTLRACGPDCFEAQQVLRGRGVWSFDVDAEGRRASFRLPLPAPDGRNVSEKLRRAWNSVRSVEVLERFRSGTGVDITTRYIFEAPDRSRVIASIGREEISIGSRRFTRERPDADWVETSDAFPTTVPFPAPWQQASAAVRLLEDATVDGRAARVLALFVPLGIWFRVAVDPDSGLPLEEHMRAIGHVMDRTYSRFNEPMGIRAPEIERK